MKIVKELSDVHFIALKWPKHTYGREKSLRCLKPLIPNFNDPSIWELIIGAISTQYPRSFVNEKNLQKQLTV